LNQQKKDEILLVKMIWYSGRIRKRQGTRVVSGMKLVFPLVSPWIFARPVP